MSTLCLEKEFDEMPSEFYVITTDVPSYYGQDCVSEMFYCFNE